MNVAKLQSDREYKKNYENTKTSYHTPGDMVSITAARMAQDVATNVNYKQPIHHYTYLPDSLSLEHTRNANQIQSDVSTRFMITQRRLPLTDEPFRLFYSDLKRSKMLEKKVHIRVSDAHSKTFRGFADFPYLPL